MTDCTGQLHPNEAALVVGDQAEVNLNGIILKGDMFPDANNTIGIEMNGTGNKLNGHGGTIDGFEDGVRAVGATDVVKNVNFVNQETRNVFFGLAADAKITECSF
jgi:hypothetical protein